MTKPVVSQIKKCSNKDMPVFISSYEKTIDKKGRVIVPNEFRKILNSDNFNGIISFASYNFPCIECMTMSSIEKLSQSIEDKQYLFIRSEDDIVSSIFADSYTLSFDCDGRVIIPKSLLNYSMIKMDLVFVGRGSSFQIWNPQLFREHQENSRRIIKEKYAHSSHA